MWLRKEQIVIPIIDSFGKGGKSNKCTLTDFFLSNVRNSLKSLRKLKLKFTMFRFTIPNVVVNFRVFDDAKTSGWMLGWGFEW